MILIITNKDDITSDYIVNKLNKNSIKYYRFNTEDFPHKVYFSFNFFKNKFEIIDSIKKIIIDISDVKSVYYRRPEYSRLRIKGLNEGEKSFLFNELVYTFEGLYKLLDSKYWLNRLFAIRQAENKIYQLILATKIGFKIPDSIITNSKNEAINFISDNLNNCVIKPIKTGFLNNPDKSQIIYTSKFKENYLKDINRVRIFPTFFQEKIDKNADIRVTIVGKKVFSAKIESQEFADTEIDWRKGESTHLKYKTIQLPNDIKEKCLGLNKILNLNFSAIDFILNKYNDFIFLEILF